MGITNVYEKTEAQMTTKEKLERDKGLVLHLDFSTPYSADNLILDKSGNNNHATVVPSTAPVWVENGMIGKGAYSFDGSNDYVRVENNIITSPTELTIAAWFNKQGEGSNYECVIHRGTDNLIGNTEFWLGVSANDFLTATIGARTGAGWAAGETAVKVVLNKWYHLAATWDGTTVRVYIDGEFNKSYALASYSNANSPTRLGASNDGTAYQYNGLIDDVRIYSTALSASEVKELYQTRATVDEGGNLSVMGISLPSAAVSDGLVGWWKLDGNALDSSGNGNDGTASNVSWVDGKIGQAGSFNGASSFISIQPMEVTSVSLWINFNLVTTISYFLGYASNRGIRYDGAKFLVYDGANGWTLVPWTKVDAFVNFTVVIRGAECDIYIDGVKIGVANKVNPLPLLSVERIGNRGDGYYFPGHIDDVRFYNRALEYGEIKLLYSLGVDSIWK